MSGIKDTLFMADRTAAGYQKGVASVQVLLHISRSLARHRSSVATSGDWRDIDSARDSILARSTRIAPGSMGHLPIEPCVRGFDGGGPGDADCRSADGDDGCRHDAGMDSGARIQLFPGESAKPWANDGRAGMRLFGAWRILSGCPLLWPTQDHHSVQGAASRVLVSLATAILHCLPPIPTDCLLQPLSSRLFRNDSLRLLMIAL